MKNLVDFNDATIAAALHNIDGRSDGLEGRDVLAWSIIREMIIRCAEAKLELDADDTFDRIVELASKTKDAYSHDTYGDERWGENVSDLVGAGYDDEAVEFVLRSKIARWANDYEISMLDYINRYVGDVGLRNMIRDAK